MFLTLGKTSFNYDFSGSVDFWQIVIFLGVIVLVYLAIKHFRNKK